MYKERMSIEYIVENLFIHLDDQSVNVRNSVTKGDNIQLDTSKGFFTSGGGGGTGCRGVALTSQSQEHGQVEAILFPGPR